MCCSFPMQRQQLKEREKGVAATPPVFRVEVDTSSSWRKSDWSLTCCMRRGLSSFFRRADRCEKFRRRGSCCWEVQKIGRCTMRSSCSRSVCTPASPWARRRPTIPVETEDLWKSSRRRRVKRRRIELRNRQRFSSIHVSFIRCVESRAAGNLIDFVGCIIGRDGCTRIWFERRRKIPAIRCLRRCRHRSGCMRRGHSWRRM